MISEKFKHAQDHYFEKADKRKYYWQTRQPFVSSNERALLPAMNLSDTKSLLEIGCGEGGNLKLLEHRPLMTVGVDLYSEKTLFAKSQLPGIHFITTDGRYLPFLNGVFDCVIIRDLLHHVVDAEKIIEEGKRVLRHGGKLFIIEANGRNPLMSLFGALIPAEKMVKRNTPEWIVSLLGSGNENLKVEMRQPFPIYRLVLHYRFGLPWLSCIPGIDPFFNWVNRLAAKWTPPNQWSYIVVQYEKE